MRALGANGFPVPKAVDVNRHAVLMEMIDAFPLTQVRKLAHPKRVWLQIMAVMERLGQCGLVHCDFNEFNLLIDEAENVTLIDFPQMVSASHPNAELFFDRDIDCLKRFFVRKYDFRPQDHGIADLVFKCAPLAQLPGKDVQSRTALWSNCCLRCLEASSRAAPRAAGRSSPTRRACWTRSCARAASVQRSRRVDGDGALVSLTAVAPRAPPLPVWRSGGARLNDVLAARAAGGARDCAGGGA